MGVDREKSHSMSQQAITESRAAGKTLTQYIVQKTANDQKLAVLMNSIQHACKVTANAIRKAGIAGFYGEAGQKNSTDDDVKKLDMISNDVWVETLSHSGVCCVLVSEEDENPIIVQDADSRGPFCVAFDPLDGSSNIDCNVSVGSIFSVFRRKNPDSDQPGEIDDILRSGNDIIAAGYCLYGAATELVISYGHGTQRFQLDPSVGEFFYISDIKLPANGGKKIYSCNEGNSVHWDAPIKDFVEECKQNSYSARYVGSMVADIHRTLLYGGIFLYPADQKSKKGKLRCLYEGMPMAFITEQAGGEANTGYFDNKIRRILEVVPSIIHDKCPIIMGCSRDVNNLVGKIEKWRDAA